MERREPSHTAAEDRVRLRKRTRTATASVHKALTRSDGVKSDRGEVRRMPWKFWARRLVRRQCSWEPSHTAALDLLRHTVRNLVSRLGVPTPTRFEGVLRKGIQACEAKPRRGEPTTATLYKMAFFVPFSTVGNGLWEKGKSGNGVLEALEVNGALGLWVFGFRALE